MLPDRPITLEERVPMKIVSARIQTDTTVQVELSHVPVGLRQDEIHIDQGVVVRSWRVKGTRLLLECSPFDVTENYTLAIDRIGTKLLFPDGILDQFYSDKPLGWHVEGNDTVFRVFAPRARQVRLVLFGRFDDEEGEEFDMQPDPDRVWEVALPGTYFGRYYGYRVFGPLHETELFDPEVVLADPYSTAVASRNHYLHPAKTLILPPEPFDWSDDAYAGVEPRDLIIYEMHVRDLTAHESSGLPEDLRGTYRGLAAEGYAGGMDHIVDLGVNAVELLPVHEFANIEPPYGEPSLLHRNIWNPYSRNHWGYMTSYFFAPESYYATGSSMEPGRISGLDGRQVIELKHLVKAFHRKGIAVLLDVVYNHVSNFDYNPLKYIDKKYYFRLDDDFNFLSQSGTGNDFRSERPMARRLILDSVRHWLTEYHVDGFRFDLAALLDWETVEEVLAVARRINPSVVLIAEAWAFGKYELAAFSDRGWASWNDRFRNGIKGASPVDARGVIFGQWLAENTPATVRSYLTGTLRKHGGLFRTASHSVNYLESHDGYTLGDFIRIATGEVKPEDVIEDADENARLTARQLQLNKLAALFLLVAQGPVMLHEGQEWARSKVIAPTEAPDPNVGRLDSNSYNKDNETNWLNFSHRDVNKELVEYYKGLIALRKAHPALRRAGPEDVVWLEAISEEEEARSLELAFGYQVCGAALDDTHDFAIMMNCEPEHSARFGLPDGDWEIVANAERAAVESLGTARSDRIVVPPTTGLILRRARSE